MYYILDIMYVIHYIASEEISMTNQQRHAVFNVLVCCFAAAAVLISIPFMGPARACGGFGFLGLLGFGPIVFYRRRKEFDERERLIHLRAVTAAGMFMFLLHVGGCLTLWLTYRQRG